jgi:hypothetical protein
LGGLLVLLLFSILGVIGMKLLFGKVLNRWQARQRKKDRERRLFSKRSWQR